MSLLRVHIQLVWCGRHKPWLSHLCTLLQVTHADTCIQIHAMIQRPARHIYLLCWAVCKLWNTSESMLIVVVIIEINRKQFYDAFYAVKFPIIVGLSASVFLFTFNWIAINRHLFFRRWIKQRQKQKEKKLASSWLTFLIRYDKYTYVEYTLYIVKIMSSPMSHCVF